MRRLFLWLFLLALPLTELPLCAETVDSVPNPRLTQRSWIADRAGVIDSSSEREINRVIDAFKRQNGSEIAVVTIQDIDTPDQTPKAFSTALFNRWGIGERHKNNGVLILLVMGQRRLEIETGTGTQRLVPNEKVAEIRDAYALPAFRQGDFGGGIFSTVQAMIREISLAEQVPAPTSAKRKSAPKPGTAKPKPTPKSQAPRSAPTPTRYQNYQPSYETSYQPVSTSSGPFDWILGLFMLSLFPIGGGALLWGVVSVVKGIAVRKCNMCGREMKRLAESEEDAFLSSDQQFEERLGGLDYKVWHCPTCNISHVERSARWFSGYEDCPMCHHHTLRVSSETIRHATEYSEGLRETSRVCQYPDCGHATRTQQVIPRDTPSRHSSSSFHSSHSSFSGSSSSHSSSSSSSSSDFGGGSSSGGGAGGNW